MSHKAESSLGGSVNAGVHAMLLAQSMRKNGFLQLCELAWRSVAEMGSTCSLPLSLKRGQGN